MKDLKKNLPKVILSHPAILTPIVEAVSCWYTGNQTSIPETHRRQCWHAGKIPTTQNIPSEIPGVWRQSSSLGLPIM